MGLIKKLFGAIFGLLGGLLGIFGIGKKSEFYLELDESEGGSPSPEEVTAPPAAPVAVSAPPEQPPAQAPAPVAVAPVKAEPSPGTFATDYLINPKSSNGSRRRPGPSLSPFKDLARQVQVPAR